MVTNLHGISTSNDSVWLVSINFSVLTSLWNLDEEHTKNFQVLLTTFNNKNAEVNPTQAVKTQTNINESFQLPCHWNPMLLLSHNFQLQTQASVEQCLQNSDSEYPQLLSLQEKWLKEILFQSLERSLEFPPFRLVFCKWTCDFSCVQVSVWEEQGVHFAQHLHLHGRLHRI